MTTRYWLYKRKNGIFYLQDRETNRQESLKTKDKSIAKGILSARNQAHAQPQLNISMAKVYLSGKSPEFLTRTWLDVFRDVEKGYEGSTLKRWGKFMDSEPVKRLTQVRLIDTEAADYLDALRHPRAGVSTNVWLRILHNRAIDLGWMLQPILTKRTWPKLRYGKRRGITETEHESILIEEKMEEYRLYYQLLWEIGASQTDVARLHNNDISRAEGQIVFQRQKLKTQGKGMSFVTIGGKIGQILDRLPKEGFLFPNLAPMREDTRAGHFGKVCKRSGITGVSLHSYRYAWAVRAKRAGMPLREAMSALGHASKAVHNAYASEVFGGGLPLEFYESQMANKVIDFKNQSSHRVA